MTHGNNQSDKGTLVQEFTLPSNTITPRRCSRCCEHSSAEHTYTSLASDSPIEKLGKVSLSSLLFPLSFPPPLLTPSSSSSMCLAGEHVPHPHPAAPEKIASSFDHFQKVFASGPHFHPEKLQQESSQSSAGSSKGGSGLLGNVDMNGREVAEDIHLLPEKFWRTPALTFSEEEMEAVMGGGAH